MQPSTADTPWPTAAQRLLLTAALDQGGPASEAWQQWQRDVDFDDIDRPSQQLLPLLYSNLARLGIDGPLTERIKGYYRLTWYRNQILFHYMAGVLQALQNAGIRTLLLKGAAMALLYYKNPALRTMEDFDVLVPPDQAMRALAVLKECGFAPKFPEPAAHGWDLVDAQGRQLDLHRYAFHYSCREAIDADFWAASVPCELQRVEPRVLCATDQLLHVCARAFYAPNGSIRWIADALLILKSFAAELDWQRLIRQGQKRRVVLQLRQALTYLVNEFAAPVPDTVLAALQNARVSFQEYAAYDLALRGTLTSARSLGVWWEYCHTQGGLGIATSFEYVRYLQERLQAPRLWQTPFYGARRALCKALRA